MPKFAEHSRQVIRDSLFHSEAHRKIWARLRGRDIRSSKSRVWRLMHEAQWRGPAGQTSHVQSGTDPALPDALRRKCVSWVTLSTMFSSIGVFQ
jgi:hypothetical protein